MENEFFYKKLACLDFGIKKNILRNLASRGFTGKYSSPKTKIGGDGKLVRPTLYFLSMVTAGDPAVNGITQVATYKGISLEYR